MSKERSVARTKKTDDENAGGAAALYSALKTSDDKPLNAQRKAGLDSLYAVLEKEFGEGTGRPISEKPRFRLCQLRLGMTVA